MSCSQDKVIGEKDAPVPAGAKVSRRRTIGLSGACRDRALLRGGRVQDASSRSGPTARGLSAACHHRQALGLQPRDIRCIHAEAPAATVTTAPTTSPRRAMLARAVNGRPVRLQWMRDDEFKWSLTVRHDHEGQGGRRRRPRGRLTSTSGAEPQHAAGAIPSINRSGAGTSPMRSGLARRAGAQPNGAATATPSRSTIPAPAHHAPSDHGQSGAHLALRSLGAMPTCLRSSPSWTSSRPPPASTRWRSASRTSRTSASAP